MALYHVRNWDGVESFRESRECFFADTKFENGKEEGRKKEGKNVSSSELNDALQKKKEFEQEQQKKEETRQQEVQQKIKKVLEKVSEQNVNSVSTNISKKLSAFQKKDVEKYLEKNVSESVSQKILETIDGAKQDEAEQFFEWATHHANDALPKRFQNFLSSLSPQEFLFEYVKGDDQNRKKYFLALLRLSPEKAETFSFVNTFDAKNFPDFFKTLSSPEKNILLTLKQKTHESHRSLISGFFENEEENIVQNILENSLRESYESGEEVNEHNEKLEQEQKMLAEVRKKLGKNVAKTVEKDIDSVSTENTQQRIQVFFASLQEHSLIYLKKQRDLGKKEIIFALDQMKFFLQGLVNTTLLSSSEKQTLFLDIKKTFDIPQKFFRAKGNPEAIVRFYLEYNSLDTKDFDLIKNIEEKKVDTEKKFLLLFSEYSDSISKILDTDLRKFSTPEQFHRFCEQQKVSPDAVIRYFKHQDPLDPYDFYGISQKAEKLGFTGSKEINTLVNTPSKIYERSIPQKTLQQWTGKKDLPVSVVRFYGTSLKEKENSLLSHLSVSEQSLAPLFSNVSAQEVSEQYSKTTKAKEIQKKIQTIKDGFTKSISLLSSENYPEAEALKKVLSQRYQENMSFFDVSPDEIKKHIKKFSSFLADFSKNSSSLSSSSRLPILSEGFDFANDQIKNENILQFFSLLQEKKESGTLQEYLRDKGEHYVKQELEKKSFEKSEKQLSLEKFSRNFSNISSSISRGEFSVLQLRSMLTMNNKYGEKFVLPLSSVENVSQEEFSQIAKNEIAFLAEKEIIIVSDRMYEEIKQGRGTDFHRAAFSHEVGHLWAKNSDFAKKAEDLLKQSGRFEQIKIEIDDLYSNNKNEASNVEEIFTSLLEAHQWGWDNFSAEKMKVSAKMENILRKIIDAVGPQTLENFFSEISEDFQQNIKKQALREQRKTLTIDKEMLSAQGDQYGEDYTDTPASESNETQDQGSPALSPYKHKEMISGMHTKQESTRKILKAIEEYKKTIPGSKSKIDQILEDANAQMELDRSDLEDFPVIPEDYAAEVQKSIDNVHEKVEEYSQQLAKLDDIEDGYLVSMWKNTRFLSMKDLGRIFTTTWEYIKRRYETRAKRRIGEAGNSMFSGVIDGLANEFDKEAENAEKEEVGNIQGALENKNPDSLWEFLLNCNTPDDLKATLQELAKRGLLDWSNKDLAKVLLKVGSNVQFYEGDYSNQIILDTKYKRALTRIYDDEEMYLQLSTENTSNVKGSIDKYLKDVETDSNVKGSISQMIEQAKNGEYVDPHKLEAYIRFLPIDGSGNPSDGFLYTVYAVSQEIIPFAAIKRLTTIENNYPIATALYNYTTLDQIKQLYRDIAWNGIRELPVEEIDSVTMDHYLFKNVMTQQGVIERSLSNLVQRDKFDHDHARLLASVGDSSSAMRFLSIESTGAMKIKDNIYPNAMAGMLQHVSSLALQKDGFDKEVLTKTLIRQAGYFTTSDGVTAGRMDANKKSKYTFGLTKYNSKPREGGAYSDDMTLKDFVKAQRKIYSSVESEAFQDILQNLVFSDKYVGANHKKIPQELQKYAENYPEIAEALSLNSLSPNIQDDAMDFWEKIVPALFEYFLNPPEGSIIYDRGEGEKNVNSILEKAKDISLGKDEAKWKNKKLDKYIPGQV